MINAVQREEKAVSSRKFKLIIAIILLLLVVFTTVFALGSSAFKPNKIFVVKYDGNQYSPGTIQIHRDDYIKFENHSDRFFWPASDIHPTHGIYPEFDPKDAIEKGKSWSFRFGRVGNWRYHDHLSPYITGIVKVLP